jgi:hypothetical protein
MRLEKTGASRFQTPQVKKKLGCSQLALLKPAPSGPAGLPGTISLSRDQQEAITHDGCLKMA